MCRTRPDREHAREVTTHSAEETIAFGRTLTELLAPPKLVLLRGDLGAGKTTLVKGIAAAFEAAAEEDVTSPTFTLVHEYRGPRANLYHIDLYRIDTPRELETLASDDLRADNSILLIEWGEKFPLVAIGMSRLCWSVRERTGGGFESLDNYIRKAAAYFRGATFPNHSSNHSSVRT